MAADWALVAPDGQVVSRGHRSSPLGRRTVRHGFWWELDGWFHHEVASDGMRCGACDITLSGETVGCLVGESPYNQRLQTVSDDATRLLDENRELMVENARLRRQLESLQRRK